MPLTRSVLRSGWGNDRICRPFRFGQITLMKLLVGLYRPMKGKILYNNLDENSINFDDLRNQIGFVTQDTQLFSGTIRENLIFVSPASTEADLMDVLKKASCLNLLERAEKGLETMIGEGGLKLSGGEKQRLSIARALLRKPRVLIFDEATSALDSLTEEEITKTIRQVSSQRNQITILIAHRLSTIMHADRIYVLEKGKVVETGTHSSLREEKGLYYAMWRQQIGERKNSQDISETVNDHNRLNSTLMEKLSVVIICFNEEKNIGRCIDSVKDDRR